MASSLARSPTPHKRILATPFGQTLSEVNQRLLYPFFNNGGRFITISQLASKFIGTDGSSMILSKKMVGATPTPSLHDAFIVWLRIGLLSFGGPAAQIALMHREIVESRQWLSEKQYLNALSFCMLLPGPEAMQLATYTGWRLHGTIGGLMAGLLFVLPGAIVILLLALLYASFGDITLFQSFFIGIKAAVIAIVIQALARVAQRALVSIEYYLIAILAFVGIFFFSLPFPYLIIAAGIYGLLKHTSEPQRESETSRATVSVRQTLMTVATWLVLWLTPIGIMMLIFPNSILAELGVFFSTLAVVTFGGAYAVLSYMAQDVVSQHQWLSASQMMDGLGLAETTPGPLILVTEFVGFMAAASGGGLALGVLGALVSLWATFMPCFLWIFAGAPYVDWIAEQPRLRSALTAITAAVVGVIFNLSLWFALHVFFREVDQYHQGPLTLWVPSLSSIDTIATLLFAGGAVLFFKYRWGVVPLLALLSLLGVGLSLVLSQ